MLARLWYGTLASIDPLAVSVRMTEIMMFRPLRMTFLHGFYRGQQPDAWLRRPARHI